MKKHLAAVISVFVLVSGIGCGSEMERASEVGSAQSAEWAVDSDEAFFAGALPRLEYKEAQPLSCNGFLEPSCGSANITFAQPWGEALFHPAAERITSQDTANDGRSIGLHWRTPNRRGICRNKAGSDNVIPESTPFRECNMAFPEGVRIEMRMGRCNYNPPSWNCESLEGWHDWTAWKAGRT
jgi:hypothetical protein